MRRTFHGVVQFSFILAIACCFIWGLSKCLAQSSEQPITENSDLPHFEIVSIKRSKMAGVIGIFNLPGGKVEATLSSVQALIMAAYNVQGFQILGGPRWISTEWYDVIAIPPEDSKSRKENPPSPKIPINEEQQKMLQALLRDRFQLRIHLEQKTGSVYLLLKGKNGGRLRQSKDEQGAPWVGSNEGGMISGDGIAGRNISIGLLASRLSRYLERPVYDQTGLKGSFDFNYSYTGDVKTREDLISSIFTSVDGIGLKLKADKGPVEYLVIDHVERPSPN
jgi:uncharacterized protein (TIGR03435 family)